MTMVQRIVTTITDDIDGTEGGERMTFALDKSEYEIDLTGPNAEGLRAILAPYIVAGRVINTPVRSRQRNRGRATAIRIWARKRGYANINVRGRIPREIETAYTLAHASATSPEPEHSLATKPGPGSEAPTEPAPGSSDSAVSDVLAGNGTTDLPKPANADVRAWAVGNRIRVNARGRIPQTIIDQYLASQQKERT